MLFICKIAIEKEDSRANIIPIYGNDPKTKLGKHLKNQFKKFPRQALIQLKKSEELVYYICMKGLLTTEEYNQHCKVSPTSLLGMIDEYYDEYMRYYKMIK